MALSFNATSPLPPPIARLELELDDELESLSYEQLVWVPLGLNLSNGMSHQD